MSGIMRRLWEALVIGVHLVREVLQIMYGYYKIMRLPQPCVSFFGGSRLHKEDVYVKAAYMLAGKLAMKGMAVLTGGGPGVMEAGNCGVEAVRGQRADVFTMGISISGMKDEAVNLCAGEQIVLDYFFARKWLLLNYSIAYVVFPGGLGTIDELSDLLNQMQTGKLNQAPVVLIGVDFWKPYTEWLANARKAGLLSPKTAPKLVITDDLDEAADILGKYCDLCINNKKSNK